MSNPITFVAENLAGQAIANEVNWLPNGSTATDAGPTGATTRTPASQGLYDQPVLVNQHTPALYVSRLVSGAAGTPDSINWLANDDAPAVLIEVKQNPSVGTGTLIADVFGLEIGMSGWQCNNNTGAPFSPFIVGLGCNVQDKGGVPNVCELRGANIAVVVQAVPNQAASSPAVTARQAVAVELDCYNGSGADAIWQYNTGNNIIGLSVVNTGPKLNTEGITIAGGTVGWMMGLNITGISETGIGIFNGGTSNLVVPIYGIAVQTGSTYGIVVGAGTVQAPTEQIAASGVYGNPSVGIMLDAKGTAGATSAKNSNSLRFNSTDATPTQHFWDVILNGTTNILHMNYNSSSAVFSFNPTTVTDLEFAATSATSASAGANGDVPAQVVGYLQWKLGGTTVKVPYYAS